MFCKSFPYKCELAVNQNISVFSYFFGKNISVNEKNSVILQKNI